MIRNSSVCNEEVRSPGERLILRKKNMVSMALLCRYSYILLFVSMIFSFWQHVCLSIYPPIGQYPLIGLPNTVDLACFTGVFIFFRRYCTQND